jgi:hypothetical protein
VDPDCFLIFPCPPAKKDPTMIRYGRAGDLDMFRGHAKLEMAPTDLTVTPVGVLLSNLGGPIYSDGLPAGALTGDPNGRTFRFRNPDARTGGGMYALKIKRNLDKISYTFSFTSYGDLSGATDENMRLHFYVGNDPDAASEGRIFVTLDAPWKRTPNGWRAPKDH